MQIIRKRVRQTTEGDAYVRSAGASLARYVEKGEVSGRHRNTSLAALTIKRIPDECAWGLALRAHKDYKSTRPGPGTLKRGWRVGSSGRVAPIKEY
jgi:hypothetical protein